MNPFLNEDTNLEAEINRVFSHLNRLDPDSDEYQKTVNQLKAFYALKHDMNKLNLEHHQFDTKIALEIEQEEHKKELDSKPWFKRVDPNTALIVIGNLAIGFGVIKYEQTGVISTRIRDFMQKI